ncbi:hypothetical protein BKP37_00595 [Anaerobacillus alkalilacustris]|uniref:HTH cro/C1-type domain-containing protein n=1 Tax=Anaerobacillus alkalilacustris TaxID=393763 RepID=A0A1S2LX09_9BACI|nr:hypothetical protein [Anaerobacillus alkalilacustris]OIJ17072.1 hypothetical protein BKP37_00595 [Anaerobacillus alkalilacustris]
MRNYSDILAQAIIESGLKLQKIAEIIEKNTGSRPTIEYLSRLKNGRIPPAGDKLNEALAVAVGIDPLDLKVAAYREKIPGDVLEKLKEQLGTA